MRLLTCARPPFGPAFRLLHARHSIHLRCVQLLWAFRAFEVLGALVLHQHGFIVENAVAVVTERLLIAALLLLAHDGQPADSVLANVLLGPKLMIHTWSLLAVFDPEHSLCGTSCSSMHSFIPPGKG